MSDFRIIHTGKHSCADDLRNAEHAYKRITKGAVARCSCGKPWKLRPVGLLWVLFVTSHGSYQNAGCVWTRCSERVARRAESRGVQQALDGGAS